MGKGNYNCKRPPFCMTSPVVIIVHTIQYCICVNIKVCNNNNRECAPFVKFAKINDREILQHTVYVYRMGMYDEAKLMHCVICIVTTN